MLDSLELEHRVNALRKKLQERKKRSRCDLIEFIQGHENDVKTSINQHGTTIARIGAMKQNAKESEQQTERLVNEKQKLESSLQNAESELAPISCQLQATGSELNHIQQARSSEEQSVMDRQRVVEFRDKKMLNTLNKYSTSLGLQFKRTGDMIEFRMIDISQHNAEKEYKVVITVDENRSYKVGYSDPPIDCLNILEKRLLDNNDLKGFVMAVRKAFKEQSRS